MNKGANPTGRAAAQKTPNRKSAAGNGDNGDQSSRTKENPTNAVGAPTPTSSRRLPLGDAADDAKKLEAINQKMLEMEAALKKAEAEKAALAQKLANAMEGNGSESDAEEPNEMAARSAKKKKQVKVPRPTGNFNIQDAMGLAGSEKRRRKYNSILRVVKELAGNAKLNWEHEWAEIPMRAKAQFFEVVRESIPDMSRYVNDWATEAIVRQWMKNKRSYAVRQGYIEVKPKWEYLKENATKQTDAPRGNGKRKETSQVSSGQSAKKARLAKTSDKTKSKCKAKAPVDEEGKDEEGASEEDDSGNQDEDDD